MGPTGDAGSGTGGRRRHLRLRQTGAVGTAGGDVAAAAAAAAASCSS